MFRPNPARSVSVCAHGVAVCVMVASSLCSAAELGRAGQGTTAYPLQRQGVIPLLRTESVPSHLVQHGDSLYAIRGTSLGASILQFEKSGLTRRQTFQLESQLEEFGLTNIQVSAAAVFEGKLLLALSSWKGLLVEFDLETSSVTRTLEIYDSSQWLPSALFLDGFGYFSVDRERIWDEDPASVLVKVDLSTFQIVETLALGTQLYFLRNPQVWNGSIYYQGTIGQYPPEGFRVPEQGGSPQSPQPQVVQVDPAELEVVRYSPVAQTSWNNGVLLDGFVFGTGNAPAQMAQIYKFDLSTLQPVETLQLDSESVGKLLTANGFLYASVEGKTSPDKSRQEPARLLKIDPESLSVLQDVPTDYLKITGVPAVDGQIAYFGHVADRGYGAGIVRVDLDTLTSTDSVPLVRGERDLDDVFKVGGFAYVIAENSPAKILKVELSSFRIVDELTLDWQDGSVLNAFAAGNFGYFSAEMVGYANGGKIVKINLDTMTKVGELLLPAARILSAVAVGSHGYFGIVNHSIYPAQPSVLKVDLDSMSQRGRLNLDTKYGCLPQVGVFGGSLYFTSCDDGSLLQVDPEQLRVVRTLDLGLTGSIYPAVFEGGHAYLFVGYENQLIKVDLQDWRILKRLNLDSDVVQMMVSGDYLHLQQGDTRLNRIELQTFTKAGSIQLPEFKMLGSDDLDGTMLIRTEAGLERISLSSQRGAIKASKLVLRKAAQGIRAVKFQANAAAGKVRVAIYDAQKKLIWQSRVVKVKKRGETLLIPIGTKQQNKALQLPAGTYYLAWQVDSSQPVPRYVKGADGSGWMLQQNFAPFPAQVTGEQVTSENWIQSLSR